MCVHVKVCYVWVWMCEYMHEYTCNQRPEESPEHPVISLPYLVPLSLSLNLERGWL